MIRIAIALLFLAAALRVAATPLSEEDATALCARYADRPGMPSASDADRHEFAAESFCGDYLYRIVGDEYDPDKARRCCLAKGDCNRELGIVYANGLGVPRDYDVATYFLCRAGDEMAPFEQWDMLAQVQDMRGGAETDDLNYCDHVTSGRGQLFCEQLSGSAAASEQAARGAALAKDFDAPTAEAARMLEEAANAYAQAEGGYESDDSRGGTAYPAMALGAQNAALAAHVDRYERLAKARAPAAGAEGVKRADADLNRAYKRAVAAAEPCPLCNESDVQGRTVLRDAQRAWIAYRDAFARFYLARWKGRAADDALRREIVAELSAERAKELDKLAAGSTR